FDRLAALGRDFRGRGAGAQAVEGRTDHVVRVARAEALGHDVAHAHHFEDGAHRATGDHAGTFGGGRDQHRRGAVLADHGVVQRAVLQGHLEQAAAGLFHGLLDGDRHFAGLALAHADAAVAVADHGQRGEAHGAAALDDLADAVDRDHLFTHAVVAFLLRSVLALCFSHVIPLELQAGFTRGFGQRLDAAMVTEARTVEGDEFDAGSLGLLGHALADQAGGGSVAAVGLLAGEFLADFGLERRGADEHAVAFRRNDIGVDVQIRAMHRQAMHAQFVNLAAGSRGTTQTGNFLVHDSSLPACLLLLGFFQDHAFIRITHALALVGFGFAIGADFSGDLADGLLVGALDHGFGLGRAFDLDPVGDIVQDIMREAQLQLQGVALDLGAETHADQVQ